MGGFQYTKKKANFFECRICRKFTVNQIDEKHCINPCCDSNIPDTAVKPLVPGDMSTNSIINVGKLLSKHQKAKEKKVTVRGKEFERGKIPSFETVRFDKIH